VLERIRAFFRPGRPRKPSDAYTSLRSKVLHVRPEQVRLVEGRHLGPVFCALMEFGLAKATGSVVVVADGTVSFYTSTGGGTLGAGEHPAAREAGMRFLDVAGDHVRSLEPTTDFPLPEPAYVRFQVRTSEANLTGVAREEALQRGRHPLSPLYFAGQDVLTEIRLLSEAGDGARAR
jgi:hypothetical protein